MRTAVFLGLLLIGLAIDGLANAPDLPGGVIKFLGVMFWIFAFMDIIEFLNNTFKEK